MKTILSQLLAFAIALLFVALGEHWGNGLISSLGLAMLGMGWFVGMMAWLANAREEKLADYATLFERKLPR